VAEGVQDHFVTNDLNTLLTALYVDLDDRVLPALGWSREHRPGRKPELSDAELACLAVAQHLLGIASERRWIRYARAHLTGMFPYLPGQSGYGKSCWDAITTWSAPGRSFSATRGSPAATLKPSSPAISART
jgi:hypothetical protein